MAYLELPTHVESHKNECGSCIPAPLRKCQGTVLLVDDEPFILRGLARMLERTAFASMPCATPNRAIECVLRQDIVLVVTDMTMPEMSGLELLRAIRNLDATLPVVLMTGNPNPFSVAQALEYGASECLIKPFDMAMFRQTVQRLARLPRSFDVGEEYP